MKLTEKVNFLLEVKSKYTYRIFQNGAGSMSVEVQLTKDFRAVTCKNFALVTTSKENFERTVSVKHLNQLFDILRRSISEYGTYGSFDANCLPQWD